MKYLLPLLVFFVFSCDLKKEPELSFDMDKWKLDKNACDGYRVDYKDEIIKNREVFLNWPERQINTFFGRPDRHRLSKRHQKFYVYFLEHGKQCDEQNSSFGDFLQIRFDAVGYVSEVEIRNDFEKLVD